MKKKNVIRLQDITFGTIAVSSLFLLFGASGANAATSAVDEVTITVPASCSLTNTIGSPHTATIETGVYQDDIGETTFKVSCNDNEGFSVYAVGYTNDEFGNTTMKPSVVAGTNAIATGTATSGDTSNWAMKLTVVSGDYAPTLETGFNDYHVVPDTYTKVASYASNTDASTGSSFKSTYGAFISQTQIADSYTGKIKYTVVHPSNADAPTAPAMLDTGQNVTVKMKNLANGTNDAGYYTSDYKIKGFRRSNTLPNDFVATTTNTISLSTSTMPVYIFFENTNDEGIMYYYAENDAPIVINPDSSYMFYCMYSLADISGVSYFDTSKVTNMAYMFAYAQNVSDISSVSNWETSKVTSIDNLFHSLKITSLDALAPGKNNNPNIWNTGNVTNMDQVFDYCSSLTDITGISNWDTANVTSMKYMFRLTDIANLDALVPGKNNNPNIWNTGNVTNMSSVFYHCESLTDITGIANWDTANVTDMGGLLLNTSITNLNALIPGKNNNSNIWNTSNVTNMSSMFRDCESLIDITAISNWDTAKVTNMNSMFSKTKITSLGALVPGKNNNPNIWNTGNVTNMGEMFYDCESLSDISGIANWDTAKVTSLYQTFYNTKITSLGALVPGKNNNPNIWNTGNVTNTKGLFSGCSLLTDISGVANWDTAKMTHISNMFSGTAITSLNALIPGKNDNPNIWNTENVIEMNAVFNECSSLTDITGITNWHTSKVTEMQAMFYDCTSLADITAISNWDTAKVTNMKYMFENTKITSLDALIPGKNNNPNIWNTGSVTNMASMFSGCSSLTNMAGIADWDVSKVKATAYSASFQSGFYRMFYGIPSTTTSGFVFNNRDGYIYYYNIIDDGTYVVRS